MVAGRERANSLYPQDKHVTFEQFDDQFTQVDPSRLEIIDELDLDSDDAAKDNQSLAMRMLGVAVLTITVIGGGSIGVVTNFVTVTDTFGQSAWRTGAVAVLFIIPTVVENYSLRMEKEIYKLFTLRMYFSILCTCFVFFFWSFGLLYASTRSIQSHAYIFNNLHGLFIILITLMTGK